MTYANLPTRMVRDAATAAWEEKLKEYRAGTLRWTMQQVDHLGTIMKLAEAAFTLGEETMAVSPADFRYFVTAFRGDAEGGVLAPQDPGTPLPP